MFHDVMIDGDPGRWSIEGIGYQSWTAITKIWTEIEESEAVLPEAFRS